VNQESKNKHEEFRIVVRYIDRFKARLRGNTYIPRFISTFAIFPALFERFKAWLRGDNYISHFISTFAIFLVISAIAFTVFVESDTTDSWSRTGDMLGAVIGIPTALAGSLVAILLAHRAYKVASDQLYYDGLNYYDQIVKDAVDIYFEQAELLRKITSDARTFVRDLAEIRAAWLELKVPSDGIELSLKKAFELNKESINGEINSLSRNIGRMMRNPLCREIWAASTNRKSRRIPAINHDIFNAEFDSGVWVNSTGNMATIDLFQDDLDRYYDVLLRRFEVPSIEQIQKIQYIYWYNMMLCGAYPDKFTKINDSKYMREGIRSKEVNAEEAFSDMIRLLHNHIYPRQATEALFEIGAILCLEEAWTGECTHINLGLAVLQDIILSYPTDDVVREAMSNMVIRRYGSDQPISAHLSTVCLDCGVANFIGKDLLYAASMADLNYGGYKLQSPSPMYMNIAEIIIPNSWTPQAVRKNAAQIELNASALHQMAVRMAARKEMA